MTRFITSLQYKYIYMLIFCFLFCFITAKGNSNFKYVSINEKQLTPSHVILTGDEITFNIDGIIVISDANESFLHETNRNAELKANNKIVFKPGTKIVPKKGEVLYASITNTNAKEERELKKITHELSVLFNEEEKTTNSISKNNDITSFFLGSSIAYALLVDNQQRKVGNIETTNQRFLAKNLTAKYPIIQIISGFRPETVLVLRI